MSGSGGFRPLPGLANPHVQTVLSLWLKGGRLPGPTGQHLVELPGGDRLVLHDNCPPGWRPGGPVGVVVHGLTGSHRSGGVVQLARRLYAHRLRVFRLDLRGAGAGFKLARGIYHAGCSDDLRAALGAVIALAPGSSVVLAGISLGGNVALKLAGEAIRHPVPQLARVAALNPPIDLPACTELLSRPNNRVYEWHFVSELARDARRRARLFRQPLPEFPQRLTLRQFDDLYTAPRNGFASVDDYYREASGAPFVATIGVPALILTSRDDPFVAIKPFERLAPPRHVEVRIAERGGHTGFLGPDGLGGLGWAERLIAGWLVGQPTGV
jgi:predicted alpha/beta-fold hydrolase